MRTQLIELLKGLEVSIPPPANCHHAIMFMAGSTEHGPDDKLALHVNRNGAFHVLFLDDADLRIAPSVLIANIVAILELIRSSSSGAPSGRPIMEPV
jgi:hypothetical protein